MLETAKSVNKACAGAPTTALHIGYHKEQVECVRNEVHARI